jgi:uncharacterized membrane protein
LSAYANWESYTDVAFDQDTGYPVSSTDFRSHILELSGYFAYFFGIPAKGASTNVIVGEYNHTTGINADDFVMQMYPSNGTVVYQSGTTMETMTETEVNLPVLIPICCIAGVFLVVAIFFIARYYKHKDDTPGDEQEILTGNSGFRNINNTEIEDDD